MRREQSAARGRRTGRQHWNSVWQWPNQMLPHLFGANREGRRMRPNDVQTMQARVLLVLSGQFGCECNSVKFVLYSCNFTIVSLNYRMISYCATTIVVRAKTNWATRVPQSSGIGPKSLAFSLVSAFFCWSPLRCYCWLHLALSAASVAFVVEPPNWRKTMRTLRKSWR